MEDYFGYYNLSDDEIVYVQVSFRKLDLLLYSNLVLDRSKLTNIPPSTARNTLNIISIPTTTDEKDLGKHLHANLDSDNKKKIKYINIIINGNIYNFIDIIREKAKYIRANHKDIITEFDMSYKFYKVLLIIY